MKFNKSKTKNIHKLYNGNAGIILATFKKGFVIYDLDLDTVYFSNRVGEAIRKTESADFRNFDYVGLLKTEGASQKEAMHANDQLDDFIRELHRAEVKADAAKKCERGSKMAKLLKASLELIVDIKKTTSKTGWARHDLDGIVSTSKNYFGGDLILNKKGDDYAIKIRCNGGTKVIAKWEGKLQDLEKMFVLAETWLSDNKAAYTDYE